MPSRIRKISKRRTLRKNKKLRKRLTKMRGGAAAAAAGPAAQGASCFKDGDQELLQIGVPDVNYLSEAPYDMSRGMYSDHAPIIYKFANLPQSHPVKNDYISIITWNVGQFGNFVHSIHKTYNHKFNMRRLETADEYKQRLTNLVAAMAIMLSNDNPSARNPYYPRAGHNYPFLFCQELPTIEPYRKQFIAELTSKNLGLVCDGDRANPNEFALIIKQRTPHSQRFNVLDKSVYRNYTYENNKPLFPNSPPSSKYPTGLPSKEVLRFEIYYYQTPNNMKTYYYVNIHAEYTEDPREIVDFLNRIVDTIQIYHITANLGIDVNNVTIYLLGDYNFNIASPAINDLILTNYGGNPLNLFANPYEIRGKTRGITSMYKLTTENAEGFSLINNFGTRSLCNIDCIIKLDLASA